jgi:hypothetical protein
MEHNILLVAPKTWGSPRSKLADIVLGAHLDAAGKPRFEMDETSRRRIFAWIDLNVPYYGTSETAYPNVQGARRMLPADLEKVLADVAGRRCSSCHVGGKIPRQFWTRITHPERNAFLMAPLDKSAGGTGVCWSEYSKKIAAEKSPADKIATDKTATEKTAGEKISTEGASTIDQRKKGLFASTDDPDYQAILKTFAPVTEMLRQKPRDDMPGATPATDVDRNCK